MICKSRAALSRPPEHLHSILLEGPQLLTAADKLMPIMQPHGEFLTVLLVMGHKILPSIGKACELGRLKGLLDVACASDERLAFA
jgi:hypothetical protein